MQCLNNRADFRSFPRSIVLHNSVAEAPCRSIDSTQTYRDEVGHATFCLFTNDAARTDFLLYSDRVYLERGLVRLRGDQRYVIVNEVSDGVDEYHDCLEILAVAKLLDLGWEFVVKLCQRSGQIVRLGRKFHNKSNSLVYEWLRTEIYRLKSHL